MHHHRAAFPSATPTRGTDPMVTSGGGVCSGSDGPVRSPTANGTVLERKWDMMELAPDGVDVGCSAGVDDGVDVDGGGDGLGVDHDGGEGIIHEGFVKGFVRVSAAVYTHSSTARSRGTQVLGKSRSPWSTGAACEGGPRTAGVPQGEAAPSIRGADPVLARTALRTHRPTAVFHCHPLDVPGRSLGPALQAVDFDRVRRCRHGQLLHCLALIQLWPARLRRSRTLFRSIAAPRAQTARPGGDTPGQPRVPLAYRLWTTRTCWSIGLGFSILSHRMAGPRADWFLNLLGQHHAPQANGTTTGSPP